MNLMGNIIELNVVVTWLVCRPPLAEGVTDEGVVLGGRGQAGFRRAARNWRQRDVVVCRR